MAYDKDGNWILEFEGSLNSLGPRWRLFAMISTVVIGGGVIVVLTVAIANGMSF